MSFSKETSSVYTVGVDGMVCNVDFSSGNILGKFKASAKAISSMAVSPGLFVCSSFKFYLFFSLNSSLGCCKFGS